MSHSLLLTSWNFEKCWLWVRLVLSYPTDWFCCFVIVMATENCFSLNVMPSLAQTSLRMADSGTCAGTLLKPFLNFLWNISLKVNQKQSTIDKLKKNKCIHSTDNHESGSPQMNSTWNLTNMMCDLFD